MKLKKFILLFVFVLLLGIQFGCKNHENERGERGDDGLTPYIGENGNWWIGDKDTLIKAQGPQGDEGAPGKDGTLGEDGLSAYELYVKYNPYYKRNEETWVKDLVNGKLAIASKENTIDAIGELDEGFSFKTKGRIVYKAKDFAIIDDETAKLLLKIDDEFKYVVGDYLSLKGSIIKENNMNIIGKEVEYEKIGHKKIKSSYYDKFDETSVLNYYVENKNDLKYIEYTGKLKYDNNCYVTEKKPTLAITNSETIEGLENLKDNEVKMKGYLIGSNGNIVFYATSVEEKKITVEQVMIKCESTIYLGYNLSKVATVYPINSPQEVEWEIANKAVASISNEGVVKGIKEGEFKIRAVSKYDRSKASEWITVKVINESEVVTSPDYRGYEIKIMTERRFEFDPFYNEEKDSRTYTNPDKIHKQEVWRKIESKYNVKINVVPDPMEGMIIAKDMNKIAKEYAESGDSPIDIMILRSNDIPKLVKDNVIYSLDEVTNKYAYDEMNPAYKESVYYKGRIYGQQIYAHQENRTSITGFLYDYGWLTKLNVEDPAKMFNEGNWTYSNFAKWVNDTQEKLDEDEFVLQASGYVYFGGMSTAAGIKISNANDYSVNLMEYEQLEFTKMMKELIANGCVSSLDDISFYDKPGASFEKGKVLMTTGNLYQASIYANIDNFGFVPFPYPDYMNKEDTKIILNDRFSYMYIRGKKYPAISSSIVMTYESVWQIMNELFITTKKNMDKDENFNYENEIEKKISKYIDNPASIEAIMFYNESRIMYDPSEYIFSSMYSLKEFASNVMAYDKDYVAEAKNRTEQLEYALKGHYNP